MFGKPFKLFTVAGIPIQADPSAAIIGVLIAAGTSQILEGVGYTRGTGIYAILAGVLFIGSILWHEGAHALMARALGIRVRSVTLYMFGGATAADLDSERPKEELFVSVIGPLSSGVLCGILVGAAVVLPPSPLEVTIGYLGIINGILAVFNMVPGFPLDGGRVLRAGVAWITRSPAKGNVVAKWVGTIVGVGGLVWAAIDLSRGDPFGAVWIGYLGFMVLMASQRLVQTEGARGVLRAIRVGQIAQPKPSALLASAPLADAARDSLRPFPAATFPVIDTADRLVGMITHPQGEAALTANPTATVADAMGPVDVTRVVAADETVLHATERLQEVPWLLVTSGGVLTGIVSMQDVEDAFAQAQAPKVSQVIPPAPPAPTPPAPPSDGDAT